MQTHKASFLTKDIAIQRLLKSLFVIMSHGELVRPPGSRGLLRRRPHDSANREKGWNGRVILDSIPSYDAARDRNCVALAITSRSRRKTPSTGRAKRKQANSMSFARPQEVRKPAEAEEVLDPRVAVVNKVAAELLIWYRSEGVLEDVYSFFLRAAESSGIKNQLSALSKELENLKSHKSATKQLSDAIRSRESSISALKVISQKAASEPYSEALIDEAQTVLSKHRVLTLTAVEALAGFRDYVRRVTFCERRLFRGHLMREGEDLVGRWRRDTCFLESSGLGQYFEFSRRSDPFLIYPAAHGRNKGRRLLEFPLSLGAKVTYAEKVLLEETYAARDSNAIRGPLESESASNTEIRVEPDTAPAISPFVHTPIYESDPLPSGQVWLSPPPLSFFLSNAHRIVSGPISTPEQLTTGGRVSPADLESHLNQDAMYVSSQNLGDASLSVPLTTITAEFQPKPPEKPVVIPPKLAMIRRKAAGISINDSPEPVLQPSEVPNASPSPIKLSDIRQNRAIPVTFKEPKDSPSPLFTRRQVSKSKAQLSHTPQPSTLPALSPTPPQHPNPALSTKTGAFSKAGERTEALVPRLTGVFEEKAFAPQALPDSETFRAPKEELKRPEKAEVKEENQKNVRDFEPVPTVIIKQPIKPPEIETKAEEKTPVSTKPTKSLHYSSKSALPKGLKPALLSPIEISPSKAASPEPEALPQPLTPTPLTLTSLPFQGPSLQSDIEVFTSSLSPALRETFWSPTAFQSLLNSSFPSLIAVNRETERVGLFAFHLNTQSTRSNRVEIVHISANSGGLLGEVLDRCLSYVWEAFPCDEITIKMRYREGQDGFKPDFELKSLLEGRGFRWKMLEKDQFGGRIMTLTTKRPETAPEKPFSSLSFFEEQLVLRLGTVVQAGQGRDNTGLSRLFSPIGPAACFRELGGITICPESHKNIADLLAKLPQKATFPATKVAKGTKSADFLQESEGQSLFFPDLEPDTVSAAACSVLGLRFPISDACLRLGSLGACFYLRLAPCPGYITAVDGFSVCYLPCDDANFALMLVPLEGRIIVENELDFFTEIYGKMTKSKELPRKLTEVWLPAFETQEKAEFQGFTGLQTASGPVSRCFQSFNVALTAPCQAFGGIRRDPSPEALVLEDSFLLGKRYLAVLSRKIDDLLPIPYFVSLIPKSAFKLHT